MKKRRYSNKAWAACQEVSADLARYKKVILAFRAEPDRLFTPDEVYKFGLWPEDFRTYDGPAINPNGVLPYEAQSYIRLQYGDLCRRATALFRRKTSKHQTRMRKMMPLLDVGHGRKNYPDQFRSCIRVRSRVTKPENGVDRVLDRARAAVRAHFSRSGGTQSPSCYFKLAETKLEQGKTATIGVYFGALSESAFTCHVTLSWIRFAFFEGLLVFGEYIVYAARPTRPDSDGNRVWEVEFLGLKRELLNQMQWGWVARSQGMGRVVQEPSGVARLYATRTRGIGKLGTSSWSSAKELLAEVDTPARPLGAPISQALVDERLVLLDALAGFEAPQIQHTEDIQAVRTYWLSKVGQTDLPGGAGWWLESLTDLLAAVVTPCAKEVVAYLESYDLTIPDRLRRSAEVKSWNDLKSLAKMFSYVSTDLDTWLYSRADRNIGQGVALDIESGGDCEGLAAARPGSPPEGHTVRGAQVGRIAQLPLPQHGAHASVLRNLGPIARIPSPYDTLDLHRRQPAAEVPPEPNNAAEEAIRRVVEMDPETRAAGMEGFLRRYLETDTLTTAALYGLPSPTPEDPDDTP